VILVRGCKRARQVKTYLKKNVIKRLYPNSSILPSLVLKEKWRPGDRSRSPMLVFSLSTMLSFPHARSAPGPPGSRTYNRYIDEQSFLATPAGHTVDAWSWVKSKDSSGYKNPRVLKYRARSLNFQRLSFVAKC